MTPGSRTIELIGRFWRAPVQVQHPQDLKLRLSDLTRKDTRTEDLRVGHVDVNFMLGVLFIIAFRLENELLQDVVITCDDATDAVR